MSTWNLKKIVIVTAAALAFSSGFAGAQVADDVAAPAGAALVREVQGGGAQVYSCRVAASGAYAWQLVAPNAILVASDGTTFGQHTAGPTWTASDGSSITADGAHPLAKVNRPGDVPALLLKVTSSRGTGVLSSVRLVRRSDTLGGLPPASGCDAAHANAVTASHYSAIYTFYR